METAGETDESRDSPNKPKTQDIGILKAPKESPKSQESPKPINSSVSRLCATHLHPLHSFSRTAFPFTRDGTG